MKFLRYWPNNYSELLKRILTEFCKNVFSIQVKKEFPIIYQMYGCAQGVHQGIHQEEYHLDHP